MFEALLRRLRPNVRIGAHCTLNKRVDTAQSCSSIASPPAQVKLLQIGMGHTPITQARLGPANLSGAAGRGRHSLRSDLRRVTRLWFSALFATGGGAGARVLFLEATAVSSSESSTILEEPRLDAAVRSSCDEAKIEPTSMRDADDDLPPESVVVHVCISVWGIVVWWCGEGGVPSPQRPKKAKVVAFVQGL